MVKEILVEALKSPLRLDLYLKKEILKQYSRKKIIQWIKSGNILVNNKKVKPSFLLKGGEKILINIKPEKVVLKPLPLEKEPEILYEDLNFIVINKPAKISVHPNFKNINSKTIAHWLILKWPFLQKVGEDPLRPGIVHRLDKETSGVLVICKNNKSFFFLKEQFKNRLVEKEYLTLVKGEFPFDKGKIDYPLARSKKFPLRKKAVIKMNEREKAKPALTYYKVEKRFKGFTLLKIFPKTGRTHQIRVHLSAIGFPIVGDKLYGKDKSNISPRLFLHSSKITFYGLHQEKIEIISPLPEELERVLAKLSPLKDN